MATKNFRSHIFSATVTIFMFYNIKISNFDQNNGILSVSLHCLKLNKTTTYKN